MPEVSPSRPGRPKTANPVTVSDEVLNVQADGSSSVDSNEELDRLKAELAALQDELNSRSEKVVEEELPSSGKFVIHFVNDGLTVLGVMTYRGQELEFEIGSPAYNDTKDLNGWSFLELRRNPEAQENLWGEEKFREGPWKGKSFADIKFEALKKLATQEGDKGISLDELTQLENLDKKRRRVPEPLPPISQGSPVGKRTGY